MWERRDRVNSVFEGLDGPHPIICPDTVTSYVTGSMGGSYVRQVRAPAAGSERGRWRIQAKESEAVPGGAGARSPGAVSGGDVTGASSHPNTEPAHIEGEELPAVVVVHESASLESTATLPTARARH
jgi:hypothetical protein